MDNFRCSICNRNFNSEDSLNQHNEIKHNPSGEIKKSNKYFIAIGLILAIAIFSYAFYAKEQKPGIHDDFAKCLTEKGIVVYGNDFCPYTAKQMNMFGNSNKYLKYIKCADNEDLCDIEGIKITPTWDINGKKYSGGQTFDKLSELSGCEWIN